MSMLRLLVLGVTGTGLVAFVRLMVLMLTGSRML